MPATRTDAVLAALKTFARQVKADAELGTRIKAGPEDQLKVSVRALVIATGAAPRPHPAAHQLCIPLNQGQWGEHLMA